MRTLLFSGWDRLRQANRYAVATGLFLLWMTALADVGLLRMIETHQQRVQVEARMEQHRAAIAALESELEHMALDPNAKERHAREAYFMHKDNEDVFVFR
jgi:cell division protein DivIC